MSDRGYALDMSSVVSHVATEMEGAGPEGPAPTVESMAATYRHVITGDLARIRLHEGADSDHEAVLWLIRAAIRELGAHAVADGDGYQLVTPLDEIRWNGRHVPRAGRDEHARLGDPFNPMTGGPFASNVRIGKAHKANPPEDATLRQSLHDNGWLPGHPAIIDERSVVITGHRRLKIAQELGTDRLGRPIEPQKVRINFGSGDEGDINRLRTAWWSNEGAKSYTPSDRQAMATYLHERGWTQASIAELLNVAQATISNDLAKQPDIINVDNVGKIDKLGRKASPGRPRSLTEDQQAFVVKNFHEFGGTMQVREIMDALDQRSISGVLKVIDQERGRREKPDAFPASPVNASGRIEQQGVTHQRQPESSPSINDAPSWQMVAELFRRLSSEDKAAFLSATGLRE